MGVEFNINIRFFHYSTLLYLFAMVAYLAYLQWRKPAVGYVATGLTAFGFVLHTASLGIRWYESYQIGEEIGHIPISNLFESMSFAAWTLILIYLLIEWKYKTKLFGAFIMPIAFLAMTYIFVAPNISKEIEPLVPALKSYWLHIHVITSFLGYAAFAVSFGVSLMYLIVTTKDKNATYTFWTVCIGAIGAVLIAISIDALYFGFTPKDVKHLFDGSFRNGALAVRAFSWVASIGLIGACFGVGLKMKEKLGAIVTNTDMLDDVGYKTIVIGFPLLTIGIITGAVWANSAWGTYWSWDPKETWSLITWLFYAAYLHARLTRGWRGGRAAVLSMVGFLAVIFTYLGVNLLLSGLHAYGSQ